MPTEFPAPTEVDRELYTGNDFKSARLRYSFRPLSKEIGSYTIEAGCQNKSKAIGFPAPLEVDRELYMLRFQFTDPVPIEFPAPTEGDRELYDVFSTKK